MGGLVAPQRIQGPSGYAGVQGSKGQPGKSQPSQKGQKGEMGADGLPGDDGYAHEDTPSCQKGNIGAPVSCGDGVVWW